MFGELIGERLVRIPRFLLRMADPLIVAEVDAAEEHREDHVAGNSRVKEPAESSPRTTEEGNQLKVRNCTETTAAANTDT